MPSLLKLETAWSLYDVSVTLRVTVSNHHITARTRHRWAHAQVTPTHAPDDHEINSCPVRRVLDNKTTIGTRLPPHSARRSASGCACHTTSHRCGGVVLAPPPEALATASMRLGGNVDLSVDLVPPSAGLTAAPKRLLLALARVGGTPAPPLLLLGAGARSGGCGDANGSLSVV